MYNILICDDDKDIVNALKIYLSDPAYHLLCRYNGREAVETVKKEEIHLILLDIMMPEQDGISAMAEIRQFSNVPILLLTAKSEESDIILGLNVGADDYITKPFKPMEVSARVKSQLRRYMTFGGGKQEEHLKSVGGITLDDESKQVTLDGEPLAVTPTEFGILKLFLQSPGKVFSPREIYEAVWGDPPLGCENTVAVHIRHLREKIEIDPSHPRYITVVWGQGYKITERFCK